MDQLDVGTLFRESQLPSGFSMPSLTHMQPLSPTMQRLIDALWSGCSFVSHGPSSGSVLARKVTLTDSPERLTLSVEFLTSEQIYRKSPTAKD